MASPTSPRSSEARYDTEYNLVDRIGRSRQSPLPTTWEDGRRDNSATKSQLYQNVERIREAVAMSEIPTSPPKRSSRRTINRSRPLPHPEFIDSDLATRAGVSDAQPQQDGYEGVPGRWNTVDSRRTSRSSANFGRRLSTASKRLSDSLEYQGWGDQALSPTFPDGSQRPGSYVQFDIDEATPEHLDQGTQTEQAAPKEKAEAQKSKYGFRFWMVMIALCVTQLLNAFEGTVTSTALPTIVDQLGGGDEFIWASSGYFLTSTVFQPLYGQMADIFGRRWLIMFAVAMFVIGSAISGAAPTMGILILGRIIQGGGGGGINVVVNIIICDLVPLRDRGKFLAIVFAAISIGTSIGPFIGGIIIQYTTWRWVFYLNIPVGCASLALLFFFLRVNAAPTSTLRAKLAQIDYGGNAIFILGVSLILVALAYAGTAWAWSSYQTIITLLFGFFSLGAFALYEGSSYCIKPTVPLRLFAPRTSVAAFTITFLHSLLTLLMIYFLPVYFQSVLLLAPTTSGISMLPTVLIMVPLSAIAGGLLSKLGRYKPFHFSGFAFLAVGLGCFIALGPATPVYGWVLVQVAAAIGAGLVLSTTLPAAQAELAEADVAAATGLWAFMRSFGIVWGVSVPAAIFNAQFASLAGQIPDAGARAQFADGAAYEHATAAFLNGFAPGLRSVIVGVYSQSLRAVWIFATAVAALGLALVFLEREKELRKTLETKFGLEDEEGEKGVGAGGKGVKLGVSRESLHERVREVEMEVV